MRVSARGSRHGAIPPRKPSHERATVDTTWTGEAPEWRSRCAHILRHASSPARERPRRGPRHARPTVAHAARCCPPPPQLPPSCHVIAIAMEQQLIDNIMLARAGNSPVERKSHRLPTRHARCAGVTEPTARCPASATPDVV